MKKTYLIITAMLLLSALPAQAQLTTTVTTIKHDSTFAQGRDYWFSFMSNYWGVNLGGKYMKIYITSAKSCTAFVECEGNTTPVPVTAYNISTFTAPEFWENESSGEIETKAIHVWCTTADLTVYDMSRNSATTDGSYIIPTIGWGTDYVVAAYGSLFEGGGTYAYDIPSEMVVTANQDNTVVDITPSCDCRQCTSGNVGGDANSTIVIYPAGSPAMFTLNRGEDVEMMPVRASDPDNFDMTGTIVHANQPVGVSGGSVCPNIPADFGYCDHVEDMMPPVRTWGETYYSTNPTQPPGEPGHDFANYLFIASQANQTIYRQSCDSSAQAECIISSQYGDYWGELSGTQKFTSNAPFLVVEYINSATYPDGQNGEGDPAEAIVLSREQFTPNAQFETPSGTEYTNYANIAVNVNDENKTLFDGKKITIHPKQCLDQNWDMFRADTLSPGVHRVEGGDSGVGVWVYGYGPDESYAWAGPSQCKTFQSPDSIAPIVEISSVCFSSFIHLSDSGAQASGLDMVRVDSFYNITYLPDSPPFIEGSETDTSGYGMYVTDPTKPAILIMSAFDVAGNHTTITTNYVPFNDKIEPPVQNLGVWISGPANIAYDTIFNTGALPFDITELQLLKGNVGFTLHDSIGGPLDLSPIPVGGRRLIQIQFEAVQPTTVTDSILFGEPPCILESVAVIGSGGANDFFVTSQDWVNVPYNGTAQGWIKTVEIENLSTNPITIDKGTWPDAHFTAVTTFPLTVPPSPGKVAFTINYTPDANSLSPLSNRTQGTWTSPQVLLNGSESPRFDSLIGNAVQPNVTFFEDTVIIDSCASADDTLTAFFTIAETGTTGSIINRVTQSDPTDFFNFIGTLTSNGTTWNPTTTAQPLSEGQSAVISVQYVVPVGENDTVVDYITAVDGNDDTIGGAPLRLTIINVSCEASSVNEGVIPSLNATIIPEEDGRSLEIIFPSDLIGPVNFALVNVLGESVLRSTLGTGTQNIDASSLPRGVYFYRLTSGAMNQSGKVILGE